MAIEIQAPNKINNPDKNKIIFLAGSIDMGKSELWGKSLIDKLKDEPIVFLNPRRDDWDNNWKQEITNKQFKEQVLWELEGMEIADIIVVVLKKDSLSPISLLELGLHAKSNKVLLFCENGFWRRGNVEILSEKYKIDMVNTFEELILKIKSLI